MNEPPYELPPPQAPVKRPRSVIWKALLIGALTLLLLIPLALIGGVIRDRQMARDSVVSEIARTWADEQRLTGPILAIPYQTTVMSEDAKGRKRAQTVRHLAYLLPQQYQVVGHLTPEVRYRSIYQSVVYRSRLAIQGQFDTHAIDALKLPPGSLLWREAFLVVGIPSVKGIETAPSLHWQGKPLDVLPGVNGVAFLNAGLYAPVTLAPAERPIPFTMTLALRGSQSLWVTPIGRQNRLQLLSAWPSPSFVGATLPSQRTVSAQGFDATWDIPYFARNYGQAFTTQSSESNALPDSAIGVELLTPVDTYRQSDRAVKYGVLFLALTFATYFLFEVVCRRRLHAFQYLLVGLALTLFYLLLIALSEVIHFEWAYLVASAAIIALITLYSRAILGTALRRAPLIIGGLLTALYGYLYILLRLEDLSLLFGALGLLVALGAIMYVTRQIDWYNE